MKSCNKATEEKTLEKQRLLSRDEVLAMFSYDPSTGDLIRRLDRGKARAGTAVGYHNGRGHLHVCINYRKYLVHRVIWFYVHGEWPAGEIDHKNGDGQDNRIDNIRVCTRQQNAGNIKARARSLPKGVTFFRDKGRTSPYIARIKVDYKIINLGAYTTPEAAHEAYVAAAKKHFGEFARSA